VLSKQIMKGNAVLDLSCADGHYTRMLRRQGASKVVGVDESQFSISIAKSLEKEEQLGIEYYCCKITQLEDIKLSHTFDTIFSVSQLSVAKTGEELREYCNTISQYLRPGGRIIFLVDSPAYNFGKGIADSFYKYGFLYKNVVGVLDDEGFMKSPSVAYTCILNVVSEPRLFNGFYWRRDILAESLEQAGFNDISWQSLQAEPGNESFWHNLLENPIIVMLTAVKVK